MLHARPIDRHRTRRARRARRTVAVVGLSGLLASTLLAAGSSAQAATWTKRDPENPRIYAGDVSRVEVAHRERKVVVRVDFRDRMYDAVDVWIDTRRARGGPELVARYDRSYSEWHGLRRAGRDFRDRRLVECDAMTATLDDDQDTVRVVVPRRCLRTDDVAPERLRVVVDSRDETYEVHDWAPGRREFGRWIAVG